MANRVLLVPRDATQPPTPARYALLVGRARRTLTHGPEREARVFADAEKSLVAIVPGRTIFVFPALALIVGVAAPGCALVIPAAVVPDGIVLRSSDAPSGMATPDPLTLAFTRRTLVVVVTGTTLVFEVLAFVPASKAMAGVAVLELGTIVVLETLAREITAASADALWITKARVVDRERFRFPTDASATQGALALCVGTAAFSDVL
jgi:hypothetical protein